MTYFTGTLFDNDGTLLDQVQGEFIEKKTATKNWWEGRFSATGANGLKLALKAGPLRLEINGGVKLNIDITRLIEGVGASFEFKSNGPPL
jgi:hypothetical protein